MNCSNCQNELLRDARFCPNCGSPALHDAEAHSAGAPESAKSRNPVLPILIAIFLVAVGASGIYFFQQNAQANLEAAAEEEYNSRSLQVDSFFRAAATGCFVLNSIGIDFDQTYLSIDARGEDDSTGANYTDIACVIYAAEIPDGVVSRIDQTTSLQGLLEDSWPVLDGLAEVEANWSYHPSSGLNMSMKITSDYQAPFDFETHYEWVRDSLSD